MALVIAQKTVKTDFWVEHIEVTLTLLETSPSEFSITYEVVYSGIRNGRAVSNAPIAIKGNGKWTVTQEPVQVDVEISNYSVDVTTKTVSLHIHVIAHSNVLGNITLFDETLGGKYGIDPVNAIMSHINMLAEMQQPQLVG